MKLLDLLFWKLGETVDALFNTVAKTTSLYALNVPALFSKYVTSVVPYTFAVAIFNTFASNDAPVTVNSSAFVNNEAVSLDAIQITVYDELKIESNSIRDNGYKFKQF